MIFGKFFWNFIFLGVVYSVSDVCQCGSVKKTPTKQQQQIILGGSASASNKGDGGGESEASVTRGKKKENVKICVHLTPCAVVRGLCVLVQRKGSGKIRLRLLGKVLVGFQMSGYF